MATGNGLEIFKTYDPNFKVANEGFAQYWKTIVHITPHTVSDEDREILTDKGWHHVLSRSQKPSTKVAVLGRRRQKDTGSRGYVARCKKRSSSIAKSSRK